MKKVVFILCTLLLVVAPVVFAQSQYNLSEQKNAEKELKLTEQKKENIKHLADVFFEKIDKTVKIYDITIIKIESRISELEEHNNDLSSVKELLNLSKESISDTKILIEETKNNINMSLSTESISKEDFISMIKSLQDSIQNTHKSVVEVIKAIKMSIK